MAALERGEASADVAGRTRDESVATCYGVCDFDGVAQAGAHLTGAAEPPRALRCPTHARAARLRARRLEPQRDTTEALPERDRDDRPPDRVDVVLARVCNMERDSSSVVSGAAGGHDSGDADGEHVPGDGIQSVEGRCANDPCGACPSERRCTAAVVVHGRACVCRMVALER